MIDGILGESTGTTPDAFSFQDTGGTVNAGYYSSAGPLTGMGMGEIATATVSGEGAAFTVGNADVGGGYGTSPRGVVLGDFLSARVMTGGEQGAEYAAKVSVGEVSAVFTVTTAGAGSLEVTFRSQRGPNDDWSTGSSPSFADPVHYYPHNIVAIYCEGGDTIKPSAISLGGTGGVLLGEIMAVSPWWKSIQFWYVPKAAEGSGVLSLTTGNNVRSYGFALWSANGAVATADTKMLAKQVSNPDTPIQTLSLTLPVGGVILFGATIEPEARAFAPLAGCTEVADFDGRSAGNDVRFWAGERDSTGQAGVIYTGHSYAEVQILAVALEPA